MIAPIALCFHCKTGLRDWSIFFVCCRLLIEFFLSYPSKTIINMQSEACGAENATLSSWLGKSKTAGLRVVSAYISTFPIDQRFTDNKLEALIRHHPGKSFSSPDQPITFALCARPPYYTKSLFIESRSGGMIDCSWRKCVANFFGKYNKTRENRTRVLNALRNEAFRSAKMKAAREALGQNCAECGKDCAKLVIDHTGMSFAQIVDEFVAEKGGVLEALSIRYAKGAYRLRSGGKVWRQFHDGKAELVGMCAKCNMHLGSRGYRSK